MGHYLTFDSPYGSGWHGDACKAALYTSLQQATLIAERHEGSVETVPCLN